MHKKILKQAFFGLIACAFLFGTCAEAQTKYPKNKTTKKMGSKIKYEPDADLLKQMHVQISVVESKKDWAQYNRQSPFVNKSGTRSAYIAQFAIDADKENLIDVIIINDSAADKFYEIRGFDFPRPFENLKWIDKDTLQFDQWINPSRGGRYAVNVKTGKLVAAGYLESK